MLDVVLLSSPCDVLNTLESDAPSVLVFIVSLESDGTTEVSVVLSARLVVSLPSNAGVVRVFSDLLLPVSTWVMPNTETPGVISIKLKK